MKQTLLSVAVILFASHAYADNPKALIESKYKEIQTIITTEKEDAVVRSKVTAVLESFTDFNEFGRLTLKKWWKDLSKKQKKQFVDRYKKLIHRSYVKRFKANQKLTLTFRGDPKIIGNKAMIETTVVSGKSEADVDYKLIKTEKGYQAYDIVIDEVSLMRSYRKQFGRIMKKDGFATLLKKMDKKIKDGSNSELKDP